MAAPHHSLPARPPVPAQPLPNPQNYGGTGYKNQVGAFAGFRPPQVPAPTRSATSTTATGISTPPMGYSGAGYAGPQYGQAYYSAASANTYGQPTPPAIRNPFPLPGQQQGNDYDADQAAQIAQWQSAYAGKDDGYGKGVGKGNANNTPLGSRTNTSTPNASTPISNVEMTSTGATNVERDVINGKAGVEVTKTVVREGGGKKWEDPTLLEWGNAHRLFIGNLAGEVTDESLHKAFSKYTSIEKARVIRDKRTTKSKGFGFVSFTNADDYFRAYKEMRGKYIGSHPITIDPVKTVIKETVHNPHHKYGKGGKGGRSGKGIRDRNNIAGHANTGAGVHKNQHPKVKGDNRKILG